KNVSEYTIRPIATGQRISALLKSCSNLATGSLRKTLLLTGVLTLIAHIITSSQETPEAVMIDSMQAAKLDAETMYYQKTAIVHLKVVEYRKKTDSLQHQKQKEKNDFPNKLKNKNLPVR